MLRFFGQKLKESEDVEECVVHTAKLLRKRIRSDFGGDFYNEGRIHARSCASRASEDGV